MRSRRTRGVKPRGREEKLNICRDSKAPWLNLTYAPFDASFVLYLLLTPHCGSKFKLAGMKSNQSMRVFQGTVLEYDMYIIRLSKSTPLFVPKRGIEVFASLFRFVVAHFPFLFLSHFCCKSKLSGKEKNSAFAGDFMLHFEYQDSEYRMRTFRCFPRFTFCVSRREGVKSCGRERRVAEFLLKI